MFCDPYSFKIFFYAFYETLAT